LTKKLLKSTLTMILCVSLVLSMSMLASAAPAITVMNGDKILDITPVLLHEGRTYAPYDKLFYELGATAGYDERTRTITAVSGETTVTIPMDDYYISVTTAGVSYELYSSDLPIENLSSGSIYLPVRYTAQALGFIVEWNEQTRTIALKTVDDLIDDSGATYTVIDKALEYNKSFMEKSHSFSGSFDMTMDMGSMFVFGMYGNEAAEPIPLTISGTATGLIDGVGEEVNMNLKTNISNVANLLSGEEELDPETKAMLQQLDSIDMNLIANNETGMIYIKSPLLSTLTETDQNAWISMDIGDAGLMPSGALGTYGFSLENLLNKDTSFRDFVEQALKRDLQSGGYSDPAETLKMINALFSDQAMTKNGDDYVVTMTESTEPYYGYDDTYSSELSLQITFSFTGEVYDGLTVSASATESYGYTEDSAYTSASELSYSYATAGQGSLSISNTLGETKTLDITVDFTFSESTQTPLREPAAGSTVIPINGLYDQDITVDIEETYDIGA
jgi:hypothetical protein